MTVNRTLDDVHTFRKIHYHIQNPTSSQFNVEWFFLKVAVGF